MYCFKSQKKSFQYFFYTSMIFFIIFGSSFLFQFANFYERIVIKCFSDTYHMIFLYHSIVMVIDFTMSNQTWSPRIIGIWLWYVVLFFLNPSLLCFWTANNFQHFETVLMKKISLKWSLLVTMLSSLHRPH